MSDHKITEFGTGDQAWAIPDGEAARQAIAALRGYVYQIHQTLSAWISLRGDDELYVEAAEDYALVAKSPDRLKEILEATQIKDTRESGSVTLNSQDVLDAIRHLFTLREANPERSVRLTFLTTSPIGKERKKPLPSGRPAIAAWQHITGHEDIEELRTALLSRFANGPLEAFLRTSSSDELYRRILDPLTFSCGAGDWRQVETANRAALVNARGEVNASLDLAERAYDVLLSEVLRTVLSDGKRMLNRRHFLDCFRKATSIAIPSQAVVDFFSQPTVQKSASVLDEARLRELAWALLEVNTPPSMSALFDDAPEVARAALASLSNANRRIVRERRSDTEKSTITVSELGREVSRRHLIIGPPGSGKSQSLWKTATEMLEGTSRIPLLLAVGDLNEWTEVLGSISEIGRKVDAADVLRHDKVCLCLDGWSEFATNGPAGERAKAIRALYGIPIIANGRQINPSDAPFESWRLDPLSADLVTRTLHDGLPGLPPPDPALLDLLRSPLVLSLHILLGGCANAKGQLLERLHRHLLRGAPERFTEALSGAVASMTLSGNRSYRRLLSELRSRSADLGLDEPVRILERLGTITERGGNVLPFHDLYWSWLSGIGFLQDGKAEQTVLRLDTRESYDLAFESGVVTLSDLADTVAAKDMVLAGEFEANREVQTADRPFDARLDNMLDDEHLNVRYRGALAGIRSRKPRYLSRSLSVISEVIEANFFPPEMLDVFRPGELFANRGIVANWLGSAGTEHLIDAIAQRGDREWVPWLEQMMRSGKLQPNLAVAAALACDGRVPNWTAAHLEELVRTTPWKLRATAERGVNAAFAAWIAERYGDIVDRWLSPNGSGWLNINRVLTNCGNESIFDSLLTRFGALSVKAQGFLGFAIVDRGAPWIGRFQTAAFVKPDLRQHHKLAAELSLDIDDETARRWIALGYDEMGWRVLVKRHGNAILPELIQGLPQSFDGLHHISTLAAMRYLENPPEHLADEIWSRIQGTMQPKAMQDVLEAVARIKPNGVPSIVTFFVDQAGALPSYHVAQIVRLYNEWQRRTSLQLVVRTPMGDMPFAEYALLSNLASNRDKDFVSRGFRYAPALAVNMVSVGAAVDDDTVLKILSDLEPLEQYEPALFSRMISSETLAKQIPALFSEVFDVMPVDDLRRLVTSPHFNLDVLLWRLSKASNPVHKSVHIELMERVLAAPTNLHHCRYIGDMLRSYSRDEVRDILRPVAARDEESARWLIRQVELVRRERLIDEAGELLDW